jgi:hypothetical protein
VADLASYFVAKGLGATGFGEVLVSAVLGVGGAVSAMRLWWPRVAQRRRHRTDAMLQAISETAER